MKHFKWGTSYKILVTSGFGESTASEAGPFAQQVSSFIFVWFSFGNVAVIAYPLGLGAFQIVW
jgi:hypothetical protein